jgi:hypothetical protein
MIVTLRGITALFGFALLMLGLGWWVHPEPAAHLLGATLLEGTGRSTQIGDSAAFFIGSGGLLLWGALRAEAEMILAGGCLVGLVAPGRMVAAAVHGGAWTLPEIVGECLILGIAIATALAIRRHHSDRLFY